MIEKSKIESIVNEFVEGTDQYLVDVYITSTNVIDVFVDSDSGISIKQCVQISRKIENTLDRETEDFELRVSSPGIDQPFKIQRQYIKYKDRNIEVLLKDQNKIEGKLTLVGEKGIKLQYKVGKKKEAKQMSKTLSYEDIVEAKPVISFK